MFQGIFGTWERGAGGGPGLPQFGAYRTELEQISIPELKPLDTSTQATLTSSNERFDDTWPVPVSWVNNMFDQDFWDIRIPHVGQIGARLSPLTFGRRKHTYTNSGARQRMFSDLQPLLDFGAPLLRSNDTLPERAIFNDGGTFNIVEAHRIRNLITAGSTGDIEDESDSETDDVPPTGAERLIIVYNCSDILWTRIIDFLERSRAPLMLGLDDMTYVSEPTFYRYITKRIENLRANPEGSRTAREESITPLELRCFLWRAERDQIYFR